MASGLPVVAKVEVMEGRLEVELAVAAGRAGSARKLLKAELGAAIYEAGFPRIAFVAVIAEEMVEPVPKLGRLAWYPSASPVAARFKPLPCLSSL